MANWCEVNESKDEGTSELRARLAADDSGIRLVALRTKLIRRALPDHSQIQRRSFQFAFLLLNVWLGGTFYFWVRHIETGALDRSMVRPAGVEGWLPIAGLMNLKYWLSTGASQPAILRRYSFSSPSWRLLFCCARDFAVGCVRSGHFRNICGALGVRFSAATFNCRAGLTFRCAV